MSLLTDYVKLDALDFVNLIKTKQITPLELLQEVIDRTEKINPYVNAVVNKMYDEAEKTLKTLDLKAPLAGLPFLLKDLGIMYKGQITSQGSRYFKDFIAPVDSDTTLRLKNAGVVIYGKTNTAEFGLSTVTEPVLFGPCRNPWDLNLTTGGSSGGAASAVSARILPIAHASDMSGSIRIPAAYCGVFGLKPTRGRISFSPMGESGAGMNTQNSISVTVRDTAALLDVLSGPAVGDPYYAEPSKLPF